MYYDNIHNVTRETILVVQASHVRRGLVIGGVKEEARMGVADEMQGGEPSGLDSVGVIEHSSPGLAL